MAFHLTSMHRHDDALPGSFSDDLRLMRSLLHSEDTRRPGSSGSRTVEPSYTYESNDEEATFEIEMPGVSKHSITIQVQGRNLVVMGRRFRRGEGGPALEVEHEQENGKGEDQEDDSIEVQESDAKPSLVYLLESRLGGNVDVNGIKADNYRDGVLTVRVPLKKQTESRKIQIGI